MTVARILDDKGRDVFTLSHDASIMDAVRSLGEHRVGAMVVVGLLHLDLNMLPSNGALDKTQISFLLRKRTICSEQRLHWISHLRQIRSVSYSE